MTNIKDSVTQWLQAGADYDAGLQLYVKAVGKGHPTIYILRIKTEANYKLLVKSLCHRAGITPPSPQKNHLKKENSLSSAQSASSASNNRKLRADYTFLSEPGTPPELKVLVSNKITAYHEYKAAHAKLFDCTTLDEELNTVRTLAENYIENHAIHQELSYYQTNRTILGKHPIFEEMQRLKHFRNMSTVDLYKRKRNIEHNIWRIEKLITEGKKPHLDFDRRRKIQSYQQELLEISKFIKE
ncbi:MAG TPA: hypothetical protein VNQ80_12280 [Parapedobacter sp.]|uniref:hypothetical protein n=1 Tax=Parapedobacter sp. TaxID=1958893 RepID=UPI002BE8412E|nr:hypothetical protein [Parapedobacter sp.]HWK58114.1 hypothetical protein [Parapedobacter sp.]